jgi:vacuolar-type H+-ATPase subunit I/STV1
LTTEEGEGETVSGWADLSPDSLEHVAEFAFGGFGAFGLRTFNALEKWSKGEDLEKREIPFLRRIEAEPSQYISVSDYFERKAVLQQKLATLQSKTGKEREAYRNRIKDNYLTMFNTLKNTDNALRRLRKRRQELKARMAQSPENAIQGASQLDAIEQKIQDLYDNFNKQYDERVGRTK